MYVSGMMKKVLEIKQCRGLWFRWCSGLNNDADCD